VIWKVVFTKQAQKDAKKLSTSGLKSKAEEIIDIFSGVRLGFCILKKRYKILDLLKNKR